MARNLEQTPGDRLYLLAQSEAYLRLAQTGQVPDEIRNWVLVGNVALPKLESADPALE